MKAAVKEADEKFGDETARILQKNFDEAIEKAEKQTASTNVDTHGGGKNAQHGDGGRRAASLEDQIAEERAKLDELVRTQGSRSEKEKIRTKIKNLEREARTAAKGENHSQRESQAMISELILPGTLAGFVLGASVTATDWSSFLEDGDGFGTKDFIRYNPEVSVVVDGGVVVSVSVADECWFEGRNLISLPQTSVVEILGEAGVLAHGLPEIWELGDGRHGGRIELVGGIELYSQDGLVTRVSIADWSLVRD